MKNIVKKPERIGNELLEELGKGIGDIHNQMNNSVISVYKIAKRITYDFDLLQKDPRRN
jgi:hypothetical protein